MPNRRSRVFIGSSLEGLNFAYAIQTELERVADPTVWDQNVFEPTKSTLEQLENMLRTYEYAILVMTPDDIQTIRGEQKKVPRDNVVAELGLFIGALGRSFVFFAVPQDEPIHLPSDFLGITPLEYLYHRTDNYLAAVQTACNKIKPRLIEQTRPKSSDGSALDVKFWHTVADREANGRDVRAQVTASKRRVIISGISLNYLVWHCARELRDALSREVLLGIIKADASPESINYYVRYSRLVRETLPTTHKLYEEFFDSLDSEQRRFFALYNATFPMTHSIGLYDDGIYVSEFCIDHPSSLCPSYSPAPGSHTHTIVMLELKELLSKSCLVCGSAGDALRISLGVDK